MAEALGVASGLAGFICLGLTVCRGLIDYYTSYRDTNSTVKTLCASIEALNEILLILDGIQNKAFDQDVVNQVKKCIDSCQEGLDFLSRKLKETTQKSTSKLATLTSPFKEKTLDKLKKTCDDLQNILKLALHALQIDGHNVTHNKLDSVRRDIAITSKSQQDEISKGIYEWLSPLIGDFDNKHLDTYNLPERQEEGAKWLVNTSEFRGWLNSNRKILWCKGSPGVGKTVLSSYVAEYLKQQSSVNGVAYVFCNYKESKKQTIINLLADLLRQFCVEKRFLKRELKVLYENHSSKQTRPSASEIIGLLSIFAAKVCQAFVVVDALDECLEENQNGLIAEIQRITPRVNLFITSRPTVNMNLDLQNIYHLEIRASDRDMTNYLESSISNSTRLNRYVVKQPSLGKEIVTCIVQKAQGMFLLAHLLLKSLESKRNRRDIEAALNLLPPSLDNMYDEAIERINSQNDYDASLARKIVSWIFYALKPFTVRELQQALAVRLDDETFDPDGIIEADELVSVCAGIIGIQTESNTIGLVHYTTQEYIQRNRDKVFLDPRKAQTEIAQTCLTFLTFKEFGRGLLHLSDEDLETCRSKYPLFDYASRHWADHARDDAEQDIIEQLLRLVTSQTTMSHAASIALVLKFDKYIGISPEESGITCLHIAAGSGLVELAGSMLDKGADVEAKYSSDYLSYTALHFAIERDYVTTARFLINRGADIEARDGLERTALGLAVTKGDMEMIELLLENQADITCRDWRGQTLLHMAARRSNADVIRVLLEKNLDIVAKDMYGETALFKAVSTAGQSVVQLLLERGASVETRNNKGEPLLFSVASSEGMNMMMMMQLLLEYGLDVQQKDHVGRTVLFRTGFHLNIEVLSLLVEKGLDVNCQDQLGMTALHVAAGSHWGDVTVPSLLDVGVDPRILDARGLTALDHVNEHREKATHEGDRAKFGETIELLKQAEHAIDNPFA